MKPTRKQAPPKPRTTYDTRILLAALAAGLPGSLTALGLLWFGDYGSKVQWTLSLFVVLFWVGFVISLRERVIRPLQTVSNLLAALREGDYSVRGRGARWEDTLGEVMMEVNALSATLHDQRLDAIEAANLLRNVMAEIDVAVFAFDPSHKLRLINRAGEKLLAQPLERLVGLDAAELGLGECLDGDSSKTVQMNFPGGSGRYGIRRSQFREHGLPHQLLVLSDLSRTLREEERQAWQRLIRVLGHELNNSLTPIKSIAGSLENLLNRDPLPEDWQEDAKRGLNIIAGRSESLRRFLEAYSKLAKLPPPRLGPVDVAAWIQRTASLETRLAVEIRPGQTAAIQADGDQLEQLLINLVRNAVDASLETGGGVRVGWSKNHQFLEVSVEDDGPGLSNTANLFVPFFTTKPGGTGIGLVLCRQIVEAHGGVLTLENREDAKGCAARLRLPLDRR